MAGFSVSVSGTKDEAKDQVKRQVKNIATRDALWSLIDLTPGTHLSLAGQLQSSADETHGSLQMNASFWTPSDR